MSRTRASCFTGISKHSKTIKALEVNRLLHLFIALEHLEHSCSGTVIKDSESGDSGTYLRVTQIRIFLLFGIFTFYISHFMSKNYLISCAFFTYLTLTYVCNIKSANNSLQLAH